MTLELLQSCFDFVSLPSVGLSRKKSYGLQQQPSVESVSTASTIGSSPWSPGVSRPPTPNLTPGLTPQGSSVRKKKALHSTPLFDINNIVIPYSMASSTRLEKLEYKEIITPRWRTLEASQGAETKEKSPAGSSEPPEDECKDLSDELFSKRHSRCEFNEKKRFLNFISGSNHRRRTRPLPPPLPRGGSLSPAPYLQSWRWRDSLKSLPGSHGPFLSTLWTKTPLATLLPLLCPTCPPPLPSGTYTLPHLRVAPAVTRPPTPLLFPPPCPSLQKKPQPAVRQNGWSTLISAQPPLATTSISRHESLAPPPCRSSRTSTIPSY